MADGRDAARGVCCMPGRSTAARRCWMRSSARCHGTYRATSSVRHGISSEASMSLSLPGRCGAETRRAGGQAAGVRSAAPRRAAARGSRRRGGRIRRSGAVRDQSPWADYTYLRQALDNLHSPGVLSSNVRTVSVDAEIHEKVQMLVTVRPEDGGVGADPARRVRVIRALRDWDETDPKVAAARDGRGGCAPGAGPAGLRAGDEQRQHRADRRCGRAVQDAGRAGQQAGLAGTLRAKNRSRCSRRPTAFAKVRRSGSSTIASRGCSYAS